MKNRIIIIFLSLFAINRAYSQDSITLYFKNEKLLFSAIKEKLELSTQDSLFSETLFNIGGNKFLYLKRSVNNILPVEFGQLGICRDFSMKVYFR